MSSFNQVTLIGRLGRDPEIRSTQAGMKIANLRVATSESWKDKGSGERQERTEWHTVVIMNEHLVEVAEKYLRKGSLAMFQGKLQTRKYTGQDGIERQQTEVVLNKFRGEMTLLDSRSGSGAPAGEERAPDRAAPRAAAPSPRKPVPAGAGSDLDDEIPFGPCWQ